MDIKDEHSVRDYYLGHSFIFFKKITDVIKGDFPDLPVSKRLAEIHDKASLYNSMRIQTPYIHDNILKNAKIFQQVDPMSTDEFRSYMKRQWEILYLQNNKAEESSNIGQQAYLWSIRNMLWGIQTLSSLKREDLKNIFFIAANFSESKSYRYIDIESVNLQFENIVNMLNVEFVGIRKELKESLRNDIEYMQREELLKQLSESIRERDVALKSLSVL
jgi:hypothetical protein